MTTNKIRLQIKNLELVDLQNQLVSSGELKYRAPQIYKELYGVRVSGFDSMTTIPKNLREKLEETYQISTINEVSFQKSSDGTIKYLFTLKKGASVESVLIPAESKDDESGHKRLTLCVSSQVGCALDCAFCATGKLKFGRNLDAGEIVDQVLEVEKLSGEKITNIVFMGMGEPFQNYENVMKAINILSNAEAMVISRKKITISTSGIVPKIMQLADEAKPVKLAISLHATTNGIRQSIMPVAKKWNIQLLRNAIEYYYSKTKIPITYEYILFDGLNNSLDDAKRLAKFVRSSPSKVNIIPFHDIGFTHPEGIAANLKPANKHQIEDFAKSLKELGVNVFIRTSSGEDIDAACGQLAFSKRHD